MYVENRYRILRAVNLVFVERSGEFVLGNFAAFMAGFFDGPDFIPGMNFLIDQRRVTFPNVRYAAVATMVPIWERLCTSAWGRAAWRSFIPRTAPSGPAG